MIKSFYAIRKPSDGEFFSIEDFYSSLKNSIISAEEYAAVKKSCTLMEIRNLGDLNTLYNFKIRLLFARYLNRELLF